MNKKVVLQIGCFLVMFALELIAVHFDPSSTMFNVLLIVALLMIPAFVLVKYVPKDAENKDLVEGPVAEAA